MSFLNQRKGKDERRIYFRIILHERMLPDPARIEPLISWLPVRLASDWATEALMNNITVTELPRTWIDLIHLIHFCRMVSSTVTLWAGPFLMEGVSDWFLLLPRFIEIYVSVENSVDPDQTPRSVASDVGLHCLPKSHNNVSFIGH